MPKPKLGTRERLLEAADREFSEHGYSGARVDRIADAAKVNKQLLYYYFGGKLGLYQAVFERMADRLQQWTDQGHVARDSLEGWVSQRAAYAFPKEWSRWLRLLMFEALEFAGRISRKTDREQRVQQLVDQLVVLQEQGRIDPDLDPKAIYVALQALLMFPGMLPQVTVLTTGSLPDDPKFEQEYRRVVAAFVERLERPGPSEDA